MRQWVRRSASVAMISGLAAMSAAATPCRPKISHDVAQRLHPVVSMLVEVQAAWRNRQDSKGRDSVLEVRYDGMFDDTTRTGDEVLALIAPFYAGAATGEDLQCEVARRGDRMLPLLRRYRDCPPLPGQDPFPPKLEMDPAVYDELIEAVARRDTCEYD
jgi:hypothetical protein